MARSDLLVSLVKAGTIGDKRSFRAAAEAIIAEERAKRHNILADTLTEVIQRNGSGGANGLRPTVPADPSPRGREFIAEHLPSYTIIAAATNHLRLIRFRGHLPKGGYDVPNGRDEAPAPTPAV